MIGPAVIPALSAYLSDSSHDIYSRAYASESLEELLKGIQKAAKNALRLSANN